MEPLRVLLVGMPLLVRDMIKRAVAMQTDMTVVGTVGTASEMADATIRERPHLIVVGLADDGLPVECDAVLAAHPAVKVLGLESAGGSALLYELAPRRQALGEVSPDEVVAAIRTAGSRSLFSTQAEGL